MMPLDETIECAAFVEEQVKLLTTSHPCDFCGAESRYLWAEGGRDRQSCERCAPEYMKRRAA
jgi:hypothetical protein